MATYKIPRWFIIDMDGINLFCDREFFTLPYDNEIEHIENIKAGLVLAAEMNEIEIDIYKQTIGI